MENNMKTGYKTTEFWVTLITTLGTLLNQAGILGSVVLPVESIATVGGIVASYVIGRSYVKK